MTGSRLRACELRVWHASPDLVIVRSSDGRIHRLPPLGAAILQRAQRFRPRDELVGIGGAALIDELVRTGLLEGEGQAAARRTAPDAPPAVPPIDRILVPTRGPSPHLDRLLAALGAASAPPEVWVVVDDPDPAAADAVRRAWPGARVVGAAQRRTLLGALVEAGADAAATRASLEAPPGPWRVGALRNLVLLLSRGRLTLSLDDDVVPRLVGGEAGAWRLTSGVDPTTTHLVESRQRRWDFDETGLVEAHAHALGRRAVDLCAGAPAVDATLASAGLDDRICAGAEVVVTSLGLAGDAGISRATTLLALAHAAPPNLAQVLDARTVLRRAPVATLTDTPLLMAACLGLDGRALLPPFFTAHRNTDGLWAMCTLRWVRPGLAAHLPAAVLHDPPARPGFTPADLARDIVAFRTTDLLMLWVGRSPPVGGTEEQRLDALAARIRQLADDPLLADTVQDVARGWVASMAGLAHRWRAAAAPPSPAVAAAVAATHAALERPPWPREYDAGGRLDEASLRAQLGRFARSLSGWTGLHRAMDQVQAAGSDQPRLG